MLGGVNARQMRVFEIVQQIGGGPLPRRIPLPIAGLLAAVEEARAWLLSTPPRLTRGVVKIFRHDWSLDSRSSVAELDFHVTPLDRGLAATLRDLE